MSILRNSIRLYVLPLLIAFSFLSLLLWSFPSFAASKNGIEIDISIETDTNKAVYPREVVPFRLDIHNKLSEAWLRIHIKTAASGINEDFSVSNLNPAADWIRKGDYYYFTQKAGSASVHRALESFLVPDLQQSQNGQLTISIYAEAISAKGFTPDFSLPDPWSGAEADSAASCSFSSGGDTEENSYAFSAYDADLIRFDEPNEKVVPSSGIWYLFDSEKQLWKFGSALSGRYASSGWYYILNPYSKNGQCYEWFYFNDSAYLETGWVAMSSDSWYHTHEISDGDLGAMDTSWYKDLQDGQTYYLDQKLGRMKYGWQTIDGKLYYFARLSDVPGPSWVYSFLGNTAAGRWIYNTLGFRSFGSMYVNERTPDGKQVDENGVKL